MNIPRYDAAFITFLRQILAGFCGADPMLSQIAVAAAAHRGPIRVHYNARPIDTAMERLEAGATLGYDAVRSTDVEAIVGMLHHLADEYVNATTKHFFESARQITEHSGRTLDAKQRPLSYDLINDLVEQMEIGFDPAGRATGLRLLVGPEAFRKLLETPPTPEQIARLDAILKRKKEACDAAKRRRRLSRHRKRT